jgi:hypothetical protein
MRKRLAAAAVCAVGVVGLGAGSAFAGEITGNGTWIAGSPDAPLHGMSECAFSGQNDEFHLFPNEDWPRTQSWGQIARGLEGGHRGVPGFACNPTRAGGASS